MKAVFEGVFAGRPAALASGLRASAVVAVLLVEGAIRPGYDPLHHFGSGLSLGSGGWVQTTNFLITGMLVVGFASGLRRALGSGRGSVAAPILTAVFGVTLVVAGSFPTDPTPGYPPRTAGTTEAITVPGMIHQAAAAGTLDASYHRLAQRLTVTLGFGCLSVIALLLLREQPSRLTPQPERSATAVP